jgi:hypothetical protein
MGLFRQEIYITSGISAASHLWSLYTLYAALPLDRIFRLESERVVSADWVVRYGNRFFQLERQTEHYAPARSEVLVCEGRDGNILIEYRGQALGWREIPAPAQSKVKESRPSSGAAVARRKWVPPSDHPWRQYPQRLPHVGPGGSSAAPVTLPCASP